MNYLKILLIFILIVFGFFIVGPIYSKKNQLEPVKNSTSSAKQKTNSSILGVVTNSVNQLLKSVSKKAEDLAGEIFGQATNFVVNTANQLAEQATDFIFKNTVPGLLKQIRKLPKKDLEKIREQLCK